jgi:hypothetical protein
MNTQTQIKTWQAQPTYADMWRACKGTADQQACLAHMAALSEHNADEREFHIAAYDAAFSSECEAEREGFIEAMEGEIAQWAAKQAHDAACYAYESRKRRHWDHNPILADQSQWIADYNAGGAA